MVNKNLFKTSRGLYTPPTDTVNEAGGRAYKMSDAHALAQFACTGTFNSTFYVSAEDQLKTVKQLVKSVDPEIVAKIAVYAHEKSFMKDMPAFLCAHLSICGPEYLKKIFHRVITNGKMLRNFAQLIRSGALGRKSFGTVSKKLIQEWFQKKNSYNIFVNSIGNDPSLADVMRMVHPKPENKEKAALFAYLMNAERVNGNLVVRGRSHKTKELSTYYEHKWEDLPSVVKLYENFKTSKDKNEVPLDIPFQFLDSLGLDKEGWTQVARSMTWQQTRQNLNTLQRHGVFENKEIVDLVAEKLRNPELIAKAKVFPYQLMVAYQNTRDVPFEVREALQDAMELAINNVPPLGKIYVCVDTSGSMGSAITGYRGSVTSSVRCIDVAALFASAILRTNKGAQVIPFAESVKNITLNPRDSVVTNAKALSSMWGGGTNCSAALWKLNHEQKKGDAVIYVSDYESWVDARAAMYGTAMLQQWNIFKGRNPKAKLVCIDLTPRTNAQVTEHPDILQVSGFNDQVFNVIASFMEGGNDKDYWLSVVKSVEI